MLNAKINQIYFSLAHQFKKLPGSYQAKLFEWMLRFTPLLVMRRLPLSYGVYLKCFSGKNGSVILDCGAHVGNCAILFSRIAGPRGKVICLEPFEKSYHELVKRIAKLKLGNVIAVNKGLWHTSKKLSLDIFNNTLACRLSTNKHKNTAVQDTIQIECITIDDLVQHLNLDKIDLIKMDIEGAEIEALQGAGKTLTELRPQFAIASYHRREGRQTCVDVEKILYSFNYKCSSIFPPHLTTCGKPR